MVEPEPQDVKARVHWLRMQRDHDLAALAERYHPRLAALHDQTMAEHAEYSAARKLVYDRYDRAIAELRAAA